MPDASVADADDGGGTDGGADGGGGTDGGTDGGVDGGFVYGSIYSVKESGGDFTTGQACADAAAPGDVCEFYTGQFSGWVLNKSGAPGKQIVFRGRLNERPIIAGTIVVTNAQHIKIDRLTFVVNTRAVYGNNPPGVSTADIFITNNTVQWTDRETTAPSFELYGDRILVENNEASGSGSDFIIVGGKHVVVRRNDFHDVDSLMSGEHIDFLQCMGRKTLPTLSFSLVEENRFRNCRSINGNHCHAMLVRTGTSGAIADTIIFRHNFVNNINGWGPSYGGGNKDEEADNVPNGRAYNNTYANLYGFVENHRYSSGSCGSTYQIGIDPIFKNNICYNSTVDGWSPFHGNAPPNNGNLTFTPGYTDVWLAPYSKEGTFSLLRDKDPLLVNPERDGVLRQGSPAFGNGVPLTVVAESDQGSGTTLRLADAHYFQHGWAGTEGDWIRIGPTTTAQIVDIDYPTGTVTLAESVERSVGAPVFLYRNSSGKVVLSGDQHVGAYGPDAR